MPFRLFCFDTRPFGPLLIPRRFAAVFVWMSRDSNACMLHFLTCNFPQCRHPHFSLLGRRVGIFRHNTKHGLPTRANHRNHMLYLCSSSSSTCQSLRLRFRQLCIHSIRNLTSSFAPSSAAHCTYSLSPTPSSNLRYAPTR